MSRKKRRQMKASGLGMKDTAEMSSQGKEKAGKEATGPLDGGPIQTFPLDGEPGQQVLVQMLATLLRQAGVGGQ